MTEVLTVQEQINSATDLAREAAADTSDTIDYGRRLKAFPRDILIAAAGEEKGRFLSQFAVLAHSRHKLQNAVDSATFLYGNLDPEEQQKAEYVADFIEHNNLSLVEE